MAKVTWTMGAAGFSRELLEARDAIKARATQLAKDTAIKISTRAKQNAPDDPATIGGDLKAAITYSGRGLTWLVGIDDRQFAARGGDSAHQYPFIYGPWHEYGLLSRGIDPHPYIRPAADVEEPGYVAQLEQLIDRAIGGG